MEINLGRIIDTEKLINNLDNIPSKRIKDYIRDLTVLNRETLKIIEILENKLTTVYTFKEVMTRYQEYYQTNDTKIIYNGEEELEEIIIEIFDLEEDVCITFDYDEEKVIAY